jgi:F-box protein, helicase, 18
LQYKQKEMQSVVKEEQVKERGELKLTPEQQLIIASAGNIKINAVAGSGKTTTIIHYAKTRPRGSRILYLAFNKSVRLEAKKKFAGQGLHNVQVETAHSLAYKPVVGRERYKVSGTGYKTHEVVQILGLKTFGERHGEYILANHINKFVNYFCNSNAEKVQDLNYADIVCDDIAKAFVKSFYPYIEKGTRQFLAKMHNREIDIIHDFYLKKFQLSRPALDFDYILFDEAQDASPAMLDIFLNQKATKVIVGDTHQQIYAWRHAVNSLDKANFQSFDLSTSFRFNQDIANLSVAVLGWKNLLQETKPVNIQGLGHSNACAQKAMIGRTNLGLLTKAISFIKEHPEVDHLYFEGNINSYTYADDGASLYDVLHLYNYRHKLIRDNLIGSMKDISDLEEYIEKTEDVQLKMMVDIVKEYGNEIPSLIRSLKQKHVEDGEKDKAEMIFSTVHRAKGMEYDEVELVEDFTNEGKVEKLKAEKKEQPDKVEKFAIAKSFEEINLLYVAVTRVKHLLRIPESLLPKEFPSSPFIQKIIKKEKETRAEYDPLSELRMRKSGWSRRVEKPEKEISTYYEEKRKVNKNAYKPWTKDAEEELKIMFYNQAPVKDLAVHFGRNEGGIISRLRKLGCMEFDQ